jgi:uncharacterized coiled-coil protein SlyX
MCWFLQMLAGLVEGRAATQRQIDATQRQVDTLAANQLQEHDRRLEQRKDIDLLGQKMREFFDRMDARQERIDQTLNRLSERQERTEQTVDRLAEQMGRLAVQMEEMGRRRE